MTNVAWPPGARSALVEVDVTVMHKRVGCWVGVDVGPADAEGLLVLVGLGLDVGERVGAGVVERVGAGVAVRVGAGVVLPVGVGVAVRVGEEAPLVRGFGAEVLGDGLELADRLIVGVVADEPLALVVGLAVRGLSRVVGVGLDEPERTLDGLGLGLVLGLGLAVERGLAAPDEVWAPLDVVDGWGWFARPDVAECR